MEQKFCFDKQNQKTFKKPMTSSLYAEQEAQLLKIIFYYNNTPKQAREGNGAKDLFCAGLCLQTEAENF